MQEGGKVSGCKEHERWLGGILDCELTHDDSVFFRREQGQSARLLSFNDQRNSTYKKINHPILSSPFFPPKPTHPLLQSHHTNTVPATS